MIMLMIKMFATDYGNFCFQLYATLLSDLSTCLLVDLKLSMIGIAEIVKGLELAKIIRLVLSAFFSLVYCALEAAAEL